MSVLSLSLCKRPGLSVVSLPYHFIQLQFPSNQSFSLYIFSIVIKKSETRMTASDLKESQTHKRLQGTLFITTKHNMRFLGVIPFSSCKTTLKEQLNGEKLDSGYLLAFG